MRGKRFVVGHAVAALAVGLLAGVAQAATPVPDRFTAVTGAMTPRAVSFRIDVREWSDDAGRAAAVEALEGGPSPGEALESLPTLGYVWQNGVGVGYALKYAHRVSTEQGERVTFVIDKRLGSYDRTPWVADVPGPQPELGYSVIELYLGADGGGDGTLSLAAGVELDAANALVALAAGAPRVLVSAKREPKPYWLEGG